MYVCSQVRGMAVSSCGLTEKKRETPVLPSAFCSAWYAGCRRRWRMGSQAVLHQWPLTRGHKTFPLEHESQVVSMHHLVITNAGGLQPLSHKALGAPNRQAVAFKMLNERAFVEVHPALLGHDICVSVLQQQRRRRRMR